MPLTVRPDEFASSEISLGENNHSVCDSLRLVVVGGGMAGFGLCDRLVRNKASKRYEITVFGDEPSPAYDRVNLSQLFSGRTS